MTQPVDAVLARLARPKKISAASWVARCPAHQDRRPSLSIRELDDGRVLLHCFAGCEVAAVLDALGLDIGELFPPRPVALKNGRPAPRRTFTAAELLHFVDKESLVVLVAAADCIRRGSLREADLERVAQARERIAGVLQCLPA